MRYIKKVICFMMIICIVITSSIDTFGKVNAKEVAQAEYDKSENDVLQLQSPSYVLMEASTGKVILEKNATEERSPASITKIMTLLLTFEALTNKKISLQDDVVTSAHAKSMGGSQVFLEEGEIQTVETLIKCIAVASGNDASVAMAEYIAGSEEAFVDRMNQKAEELGLKNTHFVDCYGLSNDAKHYTSALDVAKMSRELINKYPEVFQYTGIWMEDIVHQTKKGNSNFTLSSTNKLLKQYPWTTGLKTGSTQKAGYCFSATAQKDGMSLIAVVMAAPDFKIRFGEAKKLLDYGYQNCKLYKDLNMDDLEQITVKNGVEDKVTIKYQKEYSYLDTDKTQGKLEKKIEVAPFIEAPVTKGEKVGEAIYSINGKETGRVDLISTEEVKRAKYTDCLKRLLQFYMI